MPGVTLNQVKKAFGRTTVITDLSIDIEEGEFTVIVGPSGCGKSTTLRLIAGLETLTDGTIHIGGRNVTHLPPKARDVAMVFQSYALYPHMNVAQNMSFALRLAGVSKSEIKNRVAQAAKTLDLTALLDRKPKDLSGGQRQRVAVGRAIVRDAYCFLFDEPLSNLDAKLRANLRVELALLHQQLQRTMIYVTHDQIEAMTLADRIIVMDQGVVQQVGTPREIYTHPCNQFVAGFIGSPAMNFLTAEIASTPNGLCFQGEGFELPISNALKQRLETSGTTTVTLGLRPEHFSAIKDDQNQYHTLGLEVRVAEYVGSSQFLTAALGPNTLSAVVQSDPQTPPMTSGEYYFDVNRLYLFDPATGLAL